MNKDPQETSVDISNINNTKHQDLYFTDVLNNEMFSASSNTLQIKMKGYSTRLLLVSNDSIPVAEINFTK